MKKIYKAHILFTKEQSRFEVLENGYVAVGADGCVTGVAADLASLDRFYSVLLEVLKTI